MDELLTLCRRFDQGAINTLVRRYRNAAFNLARSITHDDQLAEDVVQQAFLSALKNLANLKHDGAFWGWLRQIIRTECVRILRKRRDSAGIT